MKILYITKYFPPEYGGIETLSKNICDFFLKKIKKLRLFVFQKKKHICQNPIIIMFIFLNLF